MSFPSNFKFCTSMGTYDFDDVFVRREIFSQGGGWLWGCNLNGRLGNNSAINQSSPVQTVSGGSNWKQVSVGTFFSASAAIKTDGTLWLWGCGACGQLALGIDNIINQSSPVQTVSATNCWKQVSLGQNYSSAIKTDGTLWMWGGSECGRLGDNKCPNSRVYTLSSPVQTVSTGTNWCQVSTNFCHSAAIKTDGTLWLWGGSECGRLGNNSVTDVSSPVQTVSTGTDWKQVAVSNYHSAAIKTDGTLWLWGLGLTGRLGNNSTTDRSSPVQTITTGTTWCQVSLGAFHSAAIKTDGTLWLWGESADGQLGNCCSTLSDRSSPVQTVSTGTNWCQVSLGYTHSAGIKTDGTLWLWGNGCLGVLGNNSTTDVSSPVQTVSTGTNWCQVSPGVCVTGAIKTDGTLWTWGCGGSGGLGTNAVTSHSSPVQTISNVTTWKQVRAGLCGMRATKTDGTLWVWGTGSDGRLGNNSTINQSSPVQTVSGGSNWSQLNYNYFYNVSSAIKTDGTLWMWGDGSNFDGTTYIGVFGDNRSTYKNDQQSPIQTVSNVTTWKQVSLGNCHSGAIKTDGTLWLWGSVDNGRLGANSLTNESSPVQTVSTGTNWKQISLACLHSAAVKTDGTLWLWGNYSCGRLGNNKSSLNVFSSPIQTVSTANTWSEISQGSYACSHTNMAAIKTDGTLWLWGCNACGRLGNNNTIDQSSPVQLITTGTTWCQVSSGGSVAAIKTDGTLWLWGQGTCGTLGNNSTLTRSSPVQTITTGTTWCQVSIGFCHSAAIKTDGTLWLWGNGGSGRLGNNNTIDRSSPVQTITTGTTWCQVSLGSLYSSAIKTDGTLWLWGGGGSGALGTNSTIDVSSPVQTVSTGTNWCQVSIGFCHSAAIKTDGTLWLWGCNAIGRLGNDSTINQSSPVQTITTGTNWCQVSLESDLSIAIKTDGTLWLWGCGLCGQLGNNAVTSRSSPVQTVTTGTNWKSGSSISNCRTFAIKTDGTLWVWGRDIDQGLGTFGIYVDVSSPVQTVTTGTNWKQLSLSLSHSSAIKTDGTLWLWGCNNIGRLGNNSTIDVSSPVQTITTGTNWKQVSPGGFHSAAIKTDGTLWLWGCGFSGQLGNDSTINQSSPVQTITTGTNWKEVSISHDFSAAIREDCY